MQQHAMPTDATTVDPVNQMKMGLIVSAHLDTVVQHVTKVFIVTHKSTSLIFLMSATCSFNVNKTRVISELKCYIRSCMNTYAIIFTVLIIMKIQSTLGFGNMIVKC